MPATFKLSGSLKDVTGGKDEYTVEPGRSVREVLESIGIVPLTVALVVVNDEQQTKDYIVREGDLVRVLAVVGGG